MECQAKTVCVRLVRIKCDELRQPQPRIHEQQSDRAVARTGPPGGAHERQQLVALKRPRRGLRQPLARHLRRPKPDGPQEVIDGRQREVHRRRRPPPLKLQMPLEVPDSVVPHERIGQRIPSRAGSAPSHSTNPATCLAYSRRVRSDNG